MSMLAKLATVTDANKAWSLEFLYPKYVEALRKTELVTKGLPTLGEILEEVEFKVKNENSPLQARQLRQR